MALLEARNRDLADLGVWFNPTLVGAGQSSVVLELREGGVVSGAVVETQPDQFRLLRIRLLRDGGPFDPEDSIIARLDGSGGFTITGVAPGSYSLYLEAYESEEAAEAGAPSQATTVGMRDGVRPNVLDIVVTPWKDTHTVQVATSGMAGDAVVISVRGAGRLLSSMRGLSDASGRYAGSILVPTSSIPCMLVARGIRAASVATIKLSASLSSVSLELVRPKMIGGRLPDHRDSEWRVIGWRDSHSWAADNLGGQFRLLVPPGSYDLELLERVSVIKIADRAPERTTFEPVARVQGVESGVTDVDWREVLRTR